MDQGTYWVAVDGQCYGMKDASGDGCIANVESAVAASGVRAVYCTFAPREKTQAAIKRWSAKWSKRTVQAQRFDASVRVNQ